MFLVLQLDAVTDIGTMIQHNSIDTIGQEFYRWPLVTEAAKNALEIRSESPCTTEA